MPVHVIGDTPLGKDNLLSLFETAEWIKNTSSSIGGKNYLREILVDHTIALLCYEPSSRTHDSFFLAARMLGADVLSHQDMRQTSAAKGETLEDYIRTLAAWPPISAIVLRHPEEGAPEKAAEILSRLGKNIPVINAGDGTQWHPTQAYLDIYTLWLHDSVKLKAGQFCGTILGDLQRARAIHSFLMEIACFKPKLYLVAPPGNALPESVAKQLAEQGLSAKKASDFQKQMARESNFYYFIRLQSERIESAEASEITELERKYSLGYGCSGLITKMAREDAIFLHPGPMRTEMPERAKWDPRFKYDQQAENGLWIRAALLKTLLNPKFSMGNK